MMDRVDDGFKLFGCKINLNEQAMEMNELEIFFFIYVSS